MHLDEIERAGVVGHAFGIGGVETFFDGVDDRGERLFTNIAEGVEVLAPAFGLYEITKGQVGFTFAANVRRVTDCAGGGGGGEKGGGVVFFLGGLCFGGGCCFFVVLA